MISLADFGSDVSDDDYLPEDQNAVLSEEESDDDIEDDLMPQSSKKRSNKNPKKRSKTNKKIKCEELNSDIDEESLKEDKPLTAEDEKKKADSLWADFLKDTDTKPKSVNKGKIVESKNSVSPVVSSIKQINKPVEEKKIKVTTIFEFAGEEVRVEKEVPVNSVEAKLSTGGGGLATRGRSAGGKSSVTGLSSVLNKIGKKQKISTLEKTKLDWDKFKKEENIEEELQSFNKGKHGYLERQDFLNRADLRQFEIEKEARATQRNQRL